MAFLLLRAGQLVGQRGNAEHVIDREQAFENDEAGDDGEAGEQFLRGHRPNDRMSAAWACQRIFEARPFGFFGVTRS